MRVDERVDVGDHWSRKIPLSSLVGYRSVSFWTTVRNAFKSSTLSCGLMLSFDPTDPGFLADPYPTLAALEGGDADLLRGIAGALVRDPARGRARLLARQAARPQLPARRRRRRVRSNAARPALAGVLGHGTVEPPLARAAGPHPDPATRCCGLHPAERREAARTRRAAGTRAARAAYGARSHGAPAGLCPAVLDRRDLPDARGAHRPGERPPGLVARDGEDVRVRHDRRAGLGCHRGGR